MELLWEIRIFGYGRKGYKRVRNIAFYVKIAIEMLVLLVLPNLRTLLTKFLESHFIHLKRTGKLTNSES